MEDNKIIFRKGKREEQDYLSIIICVVTILLLTVQVAVNRHISKVGKAFVEGEKAKQTAIRDKARKTQMENDLMEKRLAKMQEESDYLSSIEDKMKRQEGKKLQDSQRGMDYQKKLAIYNKSRKVARRK